jgi:hypothetical protein
MMLMLTLVFSVPVFGAVPAGKGNPQTAAEIVYVPTTKQQCKNGGYKELFFKNQGQCIKAFNQTA